MLGQHFRALKVDDVVLRPSCLVLQKESGFIALSAVKAAGRCKRNLYVQILLFDIIFKRAQLEEKNGRSWRTIFELFKDRKSFRLLDYRLRK